MKSLNKNTIVKLKVKKYKNIKVRKIMLTPGEIDYTIYFSKTYALYFLIAQK